MGRRRTSLTLVVVLAAVVACLTSCSSSPGNVSHTVKSEQVQGVGRIVADAEGYTLYLYTPDHQGRSTCYGTCAQVWPPLLLPPGVTKPKALGGVKQALLGTTRRRGGALQITYNHWPLYLYLDDSAPGDATGQGEGMGAWYVLSVAGTVDRGPVADDAEDGTPSATKAASASSARATKADSARS